MRDRQSEQREVEAIRRWICIAYWTAIVAPVAGLLMLLPIGLVLFLSAPGYMFSEGPPGWIGLFYILFWVGGAFLLGYRGRLPGTAAFSPMNCAACGYDLRGADHDVCPECGGAVKG